MKVNNSNIKINIGADATVNHIRIDLFKHSRDQFLELLANENIEYNEIQLFNSNAIFASGLSIMVSLVQASAPWMAFSAVLVAWVKSRSSRKVIITTKDEKIIHFEAEGLSASEVNKIIDKIECIAVIDTNKNDGNKAIFSGP